jgi:hypothetical protein
MNKKTERHFQDWREKNLPRLEAANLYAVPNLEDWLRRAFAAGLNLNKRKVVVKS